MARIKTFAALPGLFPLPGSVLVAARGANLPLHQGLRVRELGLSLALPTYKSKVLLANFRRRSPNERLLVLVRGVAVCKKGAARPGPALPARAQRDRPGTIGTGQLRRGASNSSAGFSSGRSLRRGLGAGERRAKGADEAARSGRERRTARGPPAQPGSHPAPGDAPPRAQSLSRRGCDELGSSSSSASSLS